MNPPTARLLPDRLRLPHRLPCHRLIFLVQATSSILFAALLAGSASGATDIGTRRELFVDKVLVERVDGLAFELHHPTKSPRPKSPLPEKHMVTVIKDGDIYRAWYRDKDPAYTGGSFSGNPGETVCYAESRDGHEWTFPSLHLHKINGSDDNNVILANWPPYLTDFMPFLDSRAGVDPAERYKTLAGYPGPGDKRGLKEPGRGLFAFVSPDGIHWTKKAEAIPYRPEWRHAFDSPNVSFWSEAEQLYVCYFRTWMEPGHLRSVSRATSKDFVTWTTPVELRPNLPKEHLYTTMTHPYVRAPHIYLATPTRYVPGRGTSPSYDKKDANVTEVLFMATRAGSDHYDRLSTEAFIRPGLDPARWTNRANYVADNILQTGPEELSIYHRSGDRYVIRPDGFISVHGGVEKGTLLTKPIVFAGSKLEINFSTDAPGSVWVAILDESGKTLAESDELYGDAIDQPVKWKDNARLASFAGKPVQLKFTLKQADLYSYKFGAE